jgi:hypothetical protein
MPLPFCDGWTRPSAIPLGIRQAATVADPECERPEGCLLQDECFNGLCKYTAPALFDRWPDGQPVNPNLSQQPADFGQLGDEPRRRPRPEPGS